VPRLLIVLALVTGLLMLTGCGGSSDSTATTTVTVVETAEDGTIEDADEEALEEIRAMPALLDEAVEVYDSGDQGGAADAVGDIYTVHFQGVEAPLREVNPELADELEQKLATRLPDAMEDGDQPQNVYDLVADIKSDLEQAESDLD
jgi:hypothetical protein